jgi:hypothetical protein
MKTDQMIPWFSAFIRIQLKIFMQSKDFYQRLDMKKQLVGKFRNDVDRFALIYVQP